MKSPAKDIVLIAVALFVILGCGIGIGRKSAPAARVVDPSPIEVDEESFQEMTLAKLASALDLSDEQIAEITGDIDATSDRIAESRKQALFEYYLHIRDLHDEIIPKLDPEQQIMLQTSRDNLQKVIEKRFPSLLDKHNSAAGGDAGNRD